MRVSAKVDYALRACAELAAAGDGPVKGDRLAQAQQIPLKFLENILLDLKHAGLVQSQRGAEGGYWLSLSPKEISLAEVIRAVEGPIANVRGLRPEQVEYAGTAAPLRDVWIAVRANLRAVLEVVTLGDLAAGRLPDEVAAIAGDDLPFRGRRLHEGRDVDHRGERSEPVLVDVLGAVEAEQRIREMGLHQFRRPRLPLAELALELAPVLSADRPVEDDSRHGWGSGPRRQLRNGSLAPREGRVDRRQVADHDEDHP